MRKVVDSNLLQSDRLREYLSKSTKNYVVLTDYVAMEAYKDYTLASIYRSMRILADFPKQVIVLKTTKTVCGLSGRGAGLQRRLIDERQTRAFGTYCQDLLAAKRGDASLQKWLLNLGYDATTTMDSIHTDTVNIPSVFGRVAKTYTDAEVRVLRTGSKITEEIGYKLVETILLLAKHMFKDHPQVTKLPKMRQLPNTFIFRFALCMQLLLLRWISVGSPTDVKSEKTRNDLVDMTFAAYATYFDGLLTADKKLDKIYQEAALLLPILFNVNKK